MTEQIETTVMTETMPEDSKAKDKRIRDRKDYQREYYRANKDKFKERYLEKRAELIEAQKERNKRNREKAGKTYRIKKSATEVEEFCTFLMNTSDIKKEDIMKFFEEA